MNARASSILSTGFLSSPGRTAFFPPHVLDFQASPSVIPVNITHRFSLRTRLDRYRASLSTLTHQSPERGRRVRRREKMVTMDGTQTDSEGGKVPGEEDKKKKHERGGLIKEVRRQELRRVSGRDV